MKRLLSCLVLNCCFLATFAQNWVKLSGTIGSHKIQMSLSSSGDEENSIKGRYNFADRKSSHLDLRGKLFPGSILYLEESLEGEVMGGLFLEWKTGNRWEGRVAEGGKTHPIILEVDSGNLADLMEKEDVDEKLSKDITGTYRRGYYFINDHHSKILEVGFNGGDINVFSRGKDSIEVEFDLICGPTYHIASFRGVAVKVGKRKYVFNSSIYEEDEPCHLIFEFNNKELKISQNSTGMACGFGARAYAEGHFPKRKNVPQRMEEY